MGQTLLAIAIILHCILWFMQIHTNIKTRHILEALRADLEFSHNAVYKIDMALRGKKKPNPYKCLGG